VKLSLQPERVREREELHMGLNDAFDKAKNLASENSDKVEDGIDTASDKAKDAAPDKFDGAIGNAADKAKDGLGKL
jgi:hypothetical protein